MSRAPHVRFRVTANKTRTAAQTPVGAGTPATVFREGRGELDFLFLFLGGAFLVASLRGLWGNGDVLTVVVSVVLLAISAGIFGFWIWQRTKPPLSLTIGPDEIVLRRPRDEQRIARDATGWLRIEQELQGGQWDLIAHDGDEEVERLYLFGIDLLGVAEACEAHGWPVSRMGRDNSAVAPQVAVRPRPRTRPAAVGKTMSKAQRIVVGTVIVVSFLVGLGALGVPNWYVAIPSLIVMFAAIGYSEGKW